MVIEQPATARATLVGFISDDATLRADWLAGAGNRASFVTRWDIALDGPLDRLLERSPVDLVVLDAEGSRGKALRLLEEMRSRRPAPAVVVLATAGDESMASAVERAGGSGVVERANAPELLARLVPTLSLAGPGEVPELGRLARTLTPRQVQVLAAIRVGRTNREIAELLQLSRATVDMHVHQILRKLNVRNRVEAVRLSSRLPAAGAGHAEQRLIGIEDVSAMVIPCAVRTLTATAAAVGVWSEPDQLLEVFSGGGAGVAREWCRPEHGGLGAVFASGKPMAANGSARTQLKQPAPQLEKAAAALLCVPLTADGVVVGALEVLSNVPRRFAEADLEALHELAAETVEILRTSALI